MVEDGLKPVLRSCKVMVSLSVSSLEFDLQRFGLSGFSVRIEQGRSVSGVGPRAALAFGDANSCPAATAETRPMSLRLRPTPSGGAS